MVIQWAMLPQFLCLNVLGLPDIIKDGVKTLVTGGVWVSRRGAPLESQMRKDMVPQTRTGPQEIADGISIAAIKLPFDAIS